MVSTTAPGSAGSVRANVLIAPVVFFVIPGRQLLDDIKESGHHSRVTSADG
jgi:hypothetical protein